MAKPHGIRSVAFRVQVEPDLREMEVGELEGISIAELGTSFSQFLLQWRQGQGSEKLPGGESVAELADRVWATIRRIMKRQEEETIVVVSHFFTVVVTICKALGWPLTTDRKSTRLNSSHGCV